MRIASATMICADASPPGLAVRLYRCYAKMLDIEQNFMDMAAARRPFPKARMNSVFSYWRLYALGLSPFMRGRMLIKRMLCLFVAAFYAFSLVAWALDLWSVLYRPEEWGNIFGGESFGWAYESRANYIIFDIALLLWSLLGLMLALRAVWRRRFRLIAGHVALTVALTVAYVLWVQVHMQ